MPRLPYPHTHAASVNSQFLDSSKHMMEFVPYQSFYSVSQHALKNEWSI